MPPNTPPLPPISSDTRKNSIDELLTDFRIYIAEQSSQMSLEKLMRTGLDWAEALTDSKIGFFHFVEDNKQDISLQIWSTNTLKTFCFAEGKGLHYPISKAGVWVDCIHQRCPIIHNDYEILIHKKGVPDGHPQIVRELTIPIFYNNNIVAVLGLGNKEELYTEKDVEVAQTIADLIYSNIRHKQTEDSVEFKTYYNTITGLPNRTLLFEKLTQAMSYATTSDTIVILACFALEELKDSIKLKSLMQHLTHSLKTGDTLAHTEENQFALILSNLSKPNEGEPILRRFLKTLKNLLQPNGIDKNIPVYLGFTLYPIDYAGPEALLRHAEQALYQAKRQYSTPICLYDDVHKKRKLLYEEVREELINGIKNQELVLHYQPKINLINGEVIGVEALIRWHHPKRGLLGEEEFLPAIDNTAESIQLNTWIAISTLQQIEAWNNMGYKLPISFKMNYKSLCEKNFLEFLRTQVAIWPQTIIEQLEIEILKFSNRNDFETFANVLASGVDLGIKFSLNEFGIDCANLNHFWHLPISLITINQDLIHAALEKAENLRHVEDLLCTANDFQITTLAAGVENQELAALLIDLGCTMGQGSGIARPMPAELIPDWHSGWYQDPRYRDLCRFDAQLQLDALLQRIIRSVTRWTNKMAHFVESNGQGVVHPLLNADQCYLTHWYNGLGRFRYGEHPIFPFIDAKHRALHVTASELVDLVEHDRQYQAEIDLVNLYNQQDEFINMLRKLGST